MKYLKLENEIIIDYYIKEVRPLTEQGVPIWNSSLTKKQINAIEKIQKVALKIILGQEYKSYDSACEFFGLQKLSTWRLELSTKFAIQLYRSSERDRTSTFLVSTNHSTRNQQFIHLEPIDHRLCL